MECPFFFIFLDCYTVIKGVAISERAESRELPEHDSEGRVKGDGKARKGANRE